MILYTIGFTKKSAEEFFELLKNNDIQSLIDVRLNNKSQLAGFAKGRDLDFFLREICSIRYYHELDFAPEDELLKKWQKGELSWDEYTEWYLGLLARRKAEKIFKVRYSDAGNVCLLCTEQTPEHCHRRLLAEYLKDHTDGNITEIVHL